MKVDAGWHGDALLLHTVHVYQLEPRMAASLTKR